MTQVDFATVEAAISRLPEECRYHGGQFDKAGMRQGIPNCDSCKRPWIRAKALLALEQIRQRLAQLEDEQARVRSVPELGRRPSG